MQSRYHINISVYNVHLLRVTKGFLTAVAHVEEPIFILGRFVHGLNQACCLRQGVIHKHEESFSRSQMQPATQNVDKLSNRHITRYQVSVAKKEKKNFKENKRGTLWDYYTRTIIGLHVPQVHTSSFLESGWGEPVGFPNPVCSYLQL